MSVTAEIVLLAFWSPGPGEMLLLAVVALLLYGGNLPEVARTWGKAFSEFRRNLSGIQNEINSAIYAEPEPPRRLHYYPEFRDDATSGSVARGAVVGTASAEVVTGDPGTASEAPGETATGSGSLAEAGTSGPAGRDETFEDRGSPGGPTSGPTGSTFTAVSTGGASAAGASQPPGSSGGLRGEGGLGVREGVGDGDDVREEAEAMRMAYERANSHYAPDATSAGSEQPPR